MIRTFLTVSAALVAVAPAAIEAPAAGRSCTPPRGPGDRAVHSAHLRVENISCSAGRGVALACARFTYGRSGVCSALGRRWRCASTRPAGSQSAQRCASGRRSMSILWLD